MAHRDNKGPNDELVKRVRLEGAISSVFQHSEHSRNGLNLAKSYADLTDFPELGELVLEAQAACERIKEAARARMKEIDPERTLR